MTDEDPKTETQIRERLEEIAISDAYVQIDDDAEPLDQLIQRIRAGLDQELENVSSLHQDLHAEMDGFEDLLAADTTQPQAS